MLIKQEVVRLGSRSRSGALMYPGDHVFTWVRLGSLTWILVSIEPAGV